MKSHTRPLTLTIINGSIGGKNGNTGSLIKKICKKINRIDSNIKIKIIHLHKDFYWPKVRHIIRESDALIFSDDMSNFRPIKNFSFQASSIKRIYS